MKRFTLHRRDAAKALAAIALAGCGNRERVTAPSYFQGRMSDWTLGILTDDPELATLSGLSPQDLGGVENDRLTDRSEGAVARRRTAALRRLVELRSLQGAGIPAEDTAIGEVVAAQFEAAARVAGFEFGAFSPLGGGQPYPLDQLNAGFIGLPDFMETRQPMADLLEAEAYLDRIAAFPATIDAQAAHARADAQRGYLPPQGVASSALRAAETLAGTPADQQALYQGFARRLDALVGVPLDAASATPDQRRASALKAQALALVRDRAGPAYQRTAQTLRALSAAAPAEPGVWRLPDGEAYYAAVLALETTTTLSPQEVHAIGVERVAEVSAELDASLRRMGLTTGTVGERMAAVTADPTYQYPNTEEGRAQLLADVRARIERVEKDLPTWFATLPKAALEVRRVPAAAEASSSGAYYEPPSFDGTQPGIYYVNLRNTAEMTKIDLPTQDFHEAVPGHHLQQALAQEQQDVPLLKRLMGFTAYAEGWGLYAEQLVDEQGYYSADPIGRLGYLRWQIWRAVRLVVDTGLHAMRWSREQAITTMAQATGDLRSVIESEVDRYAAIPGQACSYELGRREIVRVRDLARRALGPSFTLRDFHDQVLLPGDVPLSLLAQRIEAWAAARAPR
jgi:uncharacterized protein (DUF885 family)